MGTHIRDAGQLQQALHSAVFAVFAVKDREDHIDHFADYTVTLEGQQALATDRRDCSLTVGGMIHPGTGRQHRIILAAKIDPLAFLGDAHGEYIVLFLIDIVQNGFGRTQGNVVFRTYAAEQNANA